MYYPDIKLFKKLSLTAPAVPVTTELLLDGETPVSAFRRLRSGGAPAFLLESLEGDEIWGRYSLLAAPVPIVYRVREGRVEVTGPEGSREERPADPLAPLRELLVTRRPALLPGLPRFAGGAVGYLSYDLARHYERLPPPREDPLGLPEAELMIADTVVVFDNARHTVRVVHNTPVTGDPDRDYKSAVRMIDETVERLRATSLPAGPGISGQVTAGHDDFASNMGAARFEDGVELIRDRIRAGEAIQVVLSHRLSRRCDTHPFDVYRALRLINPSPYMFYLDFGGRRIAGASPEVLVRVDGGRLTVRPIAGTRPRGGDAGADSRLEAELRADPKERAEHVMLVDLGRNDLGRVAEFGSVRVREYMTVERYSHVMHLVSEVEATLRRGLHGLDALCATFPAGTVSGAPKVRAMEIIDALEPERRGVYAGAVGHFDYRGDLDTCIAIRTLLFQEGMVHAQVGAGIVADSVPETEWQETLHKAAALLRAVGLAGGGLVLDPHTSGRAETALRAGWGGRVSAPLGEEPSGTS